MATVYIAEFAEMQVYNGNLVPMAYAPPLVEQTVAIGGASVQSSAFNAKTKSIRVHADAICSIAVGTNPTAAATTMRMVAGQTEYFAVTPAHKIAVITNS